MPTAFSYLRFSSPKQELGDSLRRQVALARAYADRNGLTLDERSYQDLGISAFKGKNLQNQLGAFLQAVDAGAIPRGSYLLVESIDRLSRANVLEAQELFLSIIRRNIHVVTLIDNTVYSRESIEKNWTQLVVSLASMARAHEESKVKGERVRAAWANKFKNADKKIVTARCPAWMRLEDGKFVLIPEKAKIIRRIFRMSLDGMGLHLIARTLNEEGVPANVASGWHSSYINKTLKNRAVIGEFASAHGTFANYYPAVIPLKDFHRARELAKARSTGGGRKGNGIANLFSGLLKCGYCGESMKLITKVRSRKEAHRNKPYERYLQCSRYHRGLGCEGERWNAETFEHEVLRFLNELELSEPAADDPRPALQAEIAETELKISRLVDAIESGQAQALGARVVELEKKVARLKQELEKPQAPPPVDELKAALKGKINYKVVGGETVGAELVPLKLDDASRLKIQSALKLVVDRIDVYPAGTRKKAPPERKEFDRLYGPGFPPDTRYALVTMKMSSPRLVIAGAHLTMQRSAGGVKTTPPGGRKQAT